MFIGWSMIINKYLLCVSQNTVYIFLVLPMSANHRCRLSGWFSLIFPQILLFVRKLKRWSTTTQYENYNISLSQIKYLHTYQQNQSSNLIRHLLRHQLGGLDVETCLPNFVILQHSRLQKNLLILGLLRDW